MVPFDLAKVLVVLRLDVLGVDDGSEDHKIADVDCNLLHSIQEGYVDLRWLRFTIFPMVKIKKIKKYVKNLTYNFKNVETIRFTRKTY